MKLGEILLAKANTPTSLREAAEKAAVEAAQAAEKRREVALEWQRKEALRKQEAAMSRINLDELIREIAVMVVLGALLDPVPPKDKECCDEDPYP